MKYLTLFLYSCLISMALPLSTSFAENEKSQRVGEYVDDSVITTRVKSQLLAEPKLKSAEIGVETFNGVVQLSGFVKSQADINRATEIARRVKGVASVKNDMHVK